MENDVGRVSGKVAIISGGARGEEEEEARLFVSDSAKIIIGGILDSE
jgi:3alpha(or 20beta)-hydroxysteroid dehydrogenase